MKLSSFYNYNGPVRYPSVLLRFPVALIVANYLVVFGEPETQLELMQLGFYYLALLPSFIMTVFISELIYILTKFLDLRFNWLERLTMRLTVQFCLAMVFPLLLVYFMVGLYFVGSDALSNYTTYMRYDYPIVVCFVLFLNAYYLIVYLAAIKITPKKISGYQNSKAVELPVAAVIYCQDGANLAIMFTGEIIAWPKTIKESMMALPRDQYFLINRSEIVHIDCLSGYSPYQSRTLKLIFNCELSKKNSFIVSQRRVVEFKRWFVGHEGRNNV